MLSCRKQVKTIGGGHPLHGSCFRPWAFSSLHPKNHVPSCPRNPRYFLRVNFVTPPLGCFRDQSNEQEFCTISASQPVEALTTRPPPRAPTETPCTQQTHRHDQLMIARVSKQGFLIASDMEQMIKNWRTSLGSLLWSIFNHSTMVTTSAPSSVTNPPA